MILDVDIGNTRLKWLLRGGQGEKVLSGSFATVDWAGDFPDLGENIERLRVSSVNGDASQKISRFFELNQGIQAEFAQVCDGQAGLRCGYDVNKLGVDRWMALLASWVNIGRRCIVIDAGSAMTIDILADGGYLGGYIVPGFKLMQKSLGFGTWGVKVESGTANGLRAGNDTSSAVKNGCLVALVSSIKSVASDYQINDLVITGGDGPMLMGYLSDELSVVCKEGLVLDGLPIALP